jgi:NADP-dependent 3-hydroxy acid dehydrogenase YdfG
VTVWGEVFLGVIALATLVSAAIQVGVLLYAARLARRIDGLMARVEKEIQPLAEQLEAVGRNAVRVSQLAVTQAERADEAVADLTRRFDHTLDLVQSAFVAPVREGRALAAGLRAALDAFRGLRFDARRPGRVEDEDALFIG